MIRNLAWLIAVLLVCAFLRPPLREPYDPEGLEVSLDGFRLDQAMNTAEFPFGPYNDGTTTVETHYDYAHDVFRIRTVRGRELKQGERLLARVGDRRSVVEQALGPPTRAGFDG